MGMRTLDLAQFLTPRQDKHRSMPGACTGQDVPDKPVRAFNFTMHANFANLLTSGKRDAL